MPRSPGTICTNLPVSENMVPGTGLTTADPPHPAADVDLHVVYMERCHISCSHNDPLAAERSRWMGCTRHRPKMSCAPSWENADICRTEGFRDNCLLTNVEPNRCSGNPPHVGKIPNKLIHVRKYALDVAYVSPPHTNETLRKLRSRIYGVLRAVRSNTERGDVMRVVRKYPDANWKRLWTSLHTAWISDAKRSTWYMVIHDLTPTNDRLAAINMTETNRCSTCGAIDATQHRLTQCGVSQLIWN